MPVGGGDQHGQTGLVRVAEVPGLPGEAPQPQVHRSVLLLKDVLRIAAPRRQR